MNVGKLFESDDYDAKSASFYRVTKVNRDILVIDFVENINGDVRSQPVDL